MSSQIQDTRARILQASLALLEKSGGKGVRLSDIAKKAGISRQALYLHFPGRAELLIATTHYLDEVKGSDARLQPSRTAQNGVNRLDAFIEAWGGYIPEIYGIAKALIAMGDADQDAKAAWQTRMQDMRDGCFAAVTALKVDDNLNEQYTVDNATNILWTLLSVPNWEQLTQECGFSQKAYVAEMRSISHRLFVRKE